MVSACRRYLFGLLIVLGLLPSFGPALAGQLRVLVDGDSYLVNGTEVVRQNGTGSVDEITRHQAEFAARVLGDLILNSEFNRRMFGPASRAAIFADQASGRLVEPWRRLLERHPATANANEDAALPAAKDRFKSWLAESSADPRQLALTIAKGDYLDGFSAYRDNATIYRKIVKQGEALSYFDAVRFLTNQFAVAKLAAARSLESRLVAGTSGVSSTSTVDFDQESLKEIGERLHVELSRVSQARNAADLEAASQRVRLMAETRSAMLRAHRNAVKPAVVKLAVAGSHPNPNAKPSDPNRQSSVSVAAPEYPGRSASASGDGASPDRPMPSPAEKPVPNAAEAGADKAGNAANDKTPQPTDASNLGSDREARNEENRSSGGILTGTGDNRQTYSSKPYHSADGWTFNASTAMWENPADPAQWRIPPVMLCCDNTGLFFPGDSVEAHEASSGEWDRAGMDPNCNRRNACGDAKPRPIVDPATPGPSDKDEEIAAAVRYLANLPPDDRDIALAKFIVNLPSQYQHRAIVAARRYQQQSVPGNGPVNGPANRNAPPPPQTKPGYRESGVSGLGKINSRYEPITQVSAQVIVSKYKSVPGGVTLEGASNDLTFVKTARFDSKANVFILNEDMIYANPLSAEEFTQINEALAVDDKLGVSLGAELSIVYGALAPGGTVARDLKVTDRFLGAIVWGGSDLAAYKFAPGYSGRGVVTCSCAVYFNIKDVGFSPDDAGELKRSAVNLTTTLVPLAKKTAPDGGHLPDLDRIARGDVPGVAVANLKHLLGNIDYYARERTVRLAFAYAEVASFVRALKANNIRLSFQ